MVLANVADLPESPRVEVPGEGNRNLVLDVDGQKEVREVKLPAVVDIPMQPRSLCLIELK
jgi:hypothetical protein